MPDTLFSEVFGEFLQHTVSVQSAEGSDAWGTLEAADPVEVAECMVQETSKRVQVGGAGTVVLSTCQVYLDTENPGADAFTLNSTVTLPSGRTSKVLQIDRMVLSGWPSHQIVYVE